MFFFSNSCYISNPSKEKIFSFFQKPILCKNECFQQKKIFYSNNFSILQFNESFLQFYDCGHLTKFSKRISLTGSKYFSTMRYQALTPNCYPTHVILWPTKLSRQPKFYFREAICNCGLLKKRRSKTSKASLTSVIFHFRQRNSQKEVAQIAI